MNARRILLITTAAVLLGFAQPALATAANVVPIPGFEQDSAWALVPADGAFMGRDPDNPHSGSYSLTLGWGGSTGGEFCCWGATAATDPAFCAAIGPGAHPASYWYRRDAWTEYWFDAPFQLGATFYQGADCSGGASSDSLGAPSQAPAGAWEQVAGTLSAPPGTQSARFWVSVLLSCPSYSGCGGGGNFDDLEVDDMVITSVLIRSFTPTDGLVGASVDIRGANFSGASSVTFNGTAASFTVDSDSEIHAIVPSGATSGPISVTAPNGTATSSSSFTVDAPRIDSFTPASGRAGASVHLFGSNFRLATGVSFNGTPASFTVDYSGSEIFAAVPRGATTGPISVTTPTGTATSASSFTVIPNAPPTARFSFSCTALTCSFDGSASSDSDGTIQSYTWDFGDGTSGSSMTATHTYAPRASALATLTVTDNDGATASTSNTITFITLSARGYKVRALEKADLSWSGPGGASFDVYRNGGRIASVEANSYTDNIDLRGSGTYDYRVCAAAFSVCSNAASVRF